MALGYDEVLDAMDANLKRVGKVSRDRLAVTRPVGVDEEFVERPICMTSSVIKRWAEQFQSDQPALRERVAQVCRREGVPVLLPYSHRFGRGV